MKRRNTLKLAASIVVVACVAFFFVRSFEHNWSSLKEQHFELNYVQLALSGLCIALAYIAQTYGWHFAMNTLSGREGLRFRHSFSTVNASNLTKYVPGKIWSFALQMYWLARFGISKSLVLYVNGINLLYSLLGSFVVGFALLLFSPSALPRLPLALGLAALLVADLLFTIFHGPVLRWLTTLANRRFKREVGYYELPLSLILQLHVVHVFSALTFGLAAYFACLGIGHALNVTESALVMSALLLSSTIGFLAFLAPGGLGVREGVMYALLGGIANGGLSLTLPIATRAIHTIVDLILGASALRLLPAVDSTKLPKSDEAGTLEGQNGR